MTPGEPIITTSRIQGTIQTRYNPLRVVEPETLVRYLDRWRLGYLGDMARVSDVLMERDDTIRTVASKRYKAAVRHGWEIAKVECKTPQEEAQAERHAEVLTEFWDNIDVTSALDANERGGTRLLGRQMMSAIGNKYSVHEMVWKTDGGTLSCEFRHAPLWFFEATTGTLRFLETDYAMTGIEMDREQWLVTVGEGLMLPSAVTWMFKRLPLGDWLTFSEKFGFPVMHGQTDANPGDAEWEAVEKACANFTKDLALVTKRGSTTIEAIDTKTGATLPFPAMVDEAKRAIVQLWRGGDLGTMSRDGQAVGSNPQHDETALLEQDDREMLSETLNSQVEPIVIRWHFGEGVKPLAYIRFSGLNQRNTAVDIQVDDMLSRLGFPLSIQDAGERYNRTPADEGEPTLKVPAPPPAPTFGQPGMFGRPAPAAQPDPAKDKEDAEDAVENEAAAAAFASATKDALLRAVSSDLTPIRERLAAILQIQDKGILEQRLRAFRADLDKLAADIKADPESARALEDIMAAAMINGMEAANP